MVVAGALSQSITWKSQSISSLMPLLMPLLAGFFEVIGPGTRY
jgi:uncharacterized membrane protein